MTDLNQEELQEVAEHQRAIEALQGILATINGRHLIKYLFKNFEVGELPPVGYPSELLSDKLGFLRAGQSIFDLVSEADSNQAGLILAQIKREKYVQKVQDNLRQGN